MTATSPRGNEARSARTDSGLAVPPYADAPDPPADVPPPGTYPYTRGTDAEGYAAHPQAQHAHAGSGTAVATNARLRSLVAGGDTDFSLAFDLPTHLGYDADNPLSAGEVGKTGVSLCTLDDMRLLLAGLPLAEMTPRLAVSAPAALVVLMYQIVAEERGATPAQLRGAIRNDILAEYQAGGAYIFPPRAALRLLTDTLAHSARHLPLWHPITLSGSTLREAGCSAAQEIAFSLSNAVAYIEAGRAAGLDVDELAPRLRFHFGVHSDLFEEVAKFRAARKLWATILREWFGAANPQSLMLRFHAETCASTLTAQQPHNNIVRATMQALAAMLGGAESLRTLAYDEPWGLPATESATIAARTRQILAAESGVGATIDPLGGSYYVESLTDAMEAEARRIMEGVARRGGVVAATESGYIAGAIADHAYAQATRTERGERVIVGINAHTEAAEPPAAIPRPDAAAERTQRERLIAHRAARNSIACESALGVLRGAATGEGEMTTLLRSCLVAGATLGEICATLRTAWGNYTAPRPI